MKTLHYIYVAVKEHNFFYWRLFLLSFSILLIARGLAQSCDVDIIVGAFFLGMVYTTIMVDVTERVVDLEIKNMIEEDRH